MNAPSPSDQDLHLDLPPGQVAEAAAALARDGHVRIGNVFAEKTAQALHDHLASEVEWWRAVNRGDQTWDLGPESLAALTGEREREFLAHVHQGARDGFQFLFDSARVADAPEDRRARGLLLDRLVEAMNHPTSLTTFRALTGDPRVQLVDGQATRYLPGHFLTAHDDGNAGKNRIAAWVLGLTPQWRTDWGGLLQFHAANGDVTRALLPSFNAIHLFRVPQVHSVSLVAPFAAAPRYAVTGWLRWQGDEG